MILFVIGENSLPSSRIIDLIACMSHHREAQCGEITLRHSFSNRSQEFFFTNPSRSWRDGRILSSSNAICRADVFWIKEDFFKNVIVIHPRIWKQRFCQSLWGQWRRFVRVQVRHLDMSHFVVVEKTRECFVSGCGVHVG